MHGDDGQAGGRPARRKIRVGVVFGGQSGEHDVSLRSARAVMGALDPARYEVVPLGITREGQWLAGGDPLRRLESHSDLARLEGRAQEGEGEAVAGECRALVGTATPPVFDRQGAPGGPVDVIFPVLHGPHGEDGTLQGLLELANVPYVGAGVLASALAMDKAVVKTLLAQVDIPQAPYAVVLRRDWQRDAGAVEERVAREIGYPCFVKPANMGSSVGISKVHHEGELPAALDLAAAYDRKLVVEKGITGRELEISVLGNDDPIASVISEIHPAHEFYDYEAKYVDDGTTFTVPARIPEATAERLRDYALRAFKALDCAGMARVDFFLEAGTDQLLLNEINTIPGFTQISQYPRMWEASGLPFGELVERLLELALERYADKQNRL
ncbi:MAG TPA: D-alanine--D-alanine ligase family protein [Thermomicrobiales bacterium]|nr:D-alanine--D-alanine ligase family protein [Thermomicrobiales bacterium]